jgi:BirA family transcriptional regulator, biotin operon repressor / biotin---[acetyl-CoA-carboxylase] ligase
VDSHSPSDYEAALRSVLPVGRFGEPFRFLGETGSTNDEALGWATAGVPEGALVVSDHQAEGRGRRGRTWHAPPGSALLFSLVLRPKLSADRLGLLTTALGVAGVEAARSLGVDARVKWPNDVAVNGRKLAGVLVESRLSGDRVEAVAGMGVNVSTKPEEFPEDIAGIATSLAIELGEPPPRHLVLEAVLGAMDPLYGELESDKGAASLIERATELSAVLGKSVNVRMADGTLLDGRADRLKPTGALVVATGTQEIEVSAGEIEQLRPS